MNIDPVQGTHEIRRIKPETEEESARWVPLTDEQAAQLQALSAEERAKWIRANIPTKDRLSRHLMWIGLPVLAARARSGEFSDFESEHALPKNVLVRELTAAREKAIRRKGEHCEKEFSIRDLIKCVVAGEYDDNKAESDAWAAKQTGEVREIIDRMTPPARSGEGERG